MRIWRNYRIGTGRGKGQADEQRGSVEDSLGICPPVTRARGDKGPLA
jgi:hypothetical protein